MSDEKTREVLDILDWVNRLSMDELYVAAAWCESRIEPMHPQDRRTLTGLLPAPEQEKLRGILERVYVHGRWKHHYAATGEPFPVQRLERAVREGLLGLMASGGEESQAVLEARRRAVHLGEVRELVSSLSSTQEREAAGVLAREWSGSTQELLDAVRRLA